jgi:2'-hydroxyisoflavone reductase
MLTRKRSHQMLHKRNALPNPNPTNVEPRDILVLGGTRFLGRAVVAEALSLGHRVTLFNRGFTNPDLFPEAEKLRGDRAGDLSALANRTWDAVIDVAAYDPDVVRRSIEVLGDHVDRYVFVSTLSVYAGHGTTDSQQEDAPVLDVDTVTEPGELYGARKAACERIVVQTLGARATIARAGLIVGPYDPTSRFVYWPRRMARGGRVLAPGSPEDRVQFIDVRDLAAWLVRAAGTDLPGPFNVAGEPVSFSALLEACRIPTVSTELVWIPSRHLLEAGVNPWMGVPLWIAGPGWEAANAVDVDRALGAGLSHRPLTDVIAGALAYPGDDGQSPFSEDSERDLLSRLS